MKKYIFLILYLIVSIDIQGQYHRPEENIVRQFGQYLQLWCSTGDIDYRFKAQAQCASACRVNNKLMEDFARLKGLDIKNYVVPNYLNGFQAAMDKGSVNFQMTGIRTVANEDRDYGASSSQRQKFEKEYTVVVDNTIVNGSVNYNIRDSYYIRKGKIPKIEPYEEVIDKKTGKKRVKINLSGIDISDEATLGLSYNYSKHFPVGASLNATWAWFMCSIDFGWHTQKSNVHLEKLEMTDIVNYTLEKGDYTPKFFLTATPSFYYKYFSIGCGVGFMYMQGDVTTITQNLSENEVNAFLNGATNSLAYGPSSTRTDDNEKTKLMLRPSVKGFIPITRSCSLSLCVGYDYIFGYKKLNGINCGLGFQWDCDWDWIKF